MKTKFLSIHLIIFHLCTFCLLLQGQNIIRIPADYPTIQQGLDAAQANTTILVSPGIYYENLIWPYHIDGINLIGIEGSTKTIIDGDYKGRVITIEGPFPPERIYISIATVLQGLTIQHGKILGGFGAGMYCYRANPVIRDLKFIQNECNGTDCHGGGAYLDKFYGTIDNCQFIENKIESTVMAVGAGLYVDDPGNLKMINCIFKNNSCRSNIWCFGGGMAFLTFDVNQNDSVNLTFFNCKFIQNNINSTQTSPIGAGLFVDLFPSEKINSLTIDSCYFYQNDNLSEIGDGGALYSNALNLNINNSNFVENNSDRGAGIYIDSYNSRLNILNIENTTFGKNKSYTKDGKNGSAIYVSSFAIEMLLLNILMNNNQSSAISINNNESTIQMIHCTSYNNESSNDYNSSIVNAKNSIFWNQNTQEFNQFNHNINLNHCIVKGGYLGESNLDKDPLLLSLELPIPNFNSPCLNAGILIPTVNADINRYPRPMPINSNPDIGAYEMDQYFAHVLVKYYYDINQNGIRDNNERHLSFGSVKDHNGQTHVNYSEIGSYIILQQGMASIQFVEDITSDWKSSGQNFYQFNVNSAQFSEKVEIGLYPTTTQSKLSTMVFGNNFRCGEEVRFTITLTNNGTTIESGFFWLKMDDRLDSIWFTDLPDAIISKHEFSWRYQDLYPGESITKEFFVLAPRITNPTELGEIYKFCHGVSGLSLRDDNCYLAELRCAFDPNDKFSIPQREDQYSLKGEPMIYTIRFQNTGNDYARNVIIRDNIDRSFNLNSLKILQTSHPDILEVSYDDARELVFSFKNIFLPDSTTDYEGSNGYVIYSLEYNDGLPENTVVNNTANIFFDFNPAIVTNTTHNIVVTEYPTSTSDPNENRIFVYPNPATNYLEFSQKVDRSILFNLQGQIINQSNTTNNLIIHSAQGTYILRLESEGYFYYHKVLVIGN